MISTRNTRRTASIFAAFALLAGATAPAFAAPSDPSTESKAAAQKDKSDAMKKRVCIVQNTTGSILAKRECKTRGEWIAETGIDPLKK